MRQRAVLLSLVSEGALCVEAWSACFSQQGQMGAQRKGHVQGGGLTNTRQEKCQPFLEVRVQTKVSVCVPVCVCVCGGGGHGQAE